MKKPQAQGEQSHKRQSHTKRHNKILRCLTNMPTSTEEEFMFYFFSFLISYIYISTCFLKPRKPLGSITNIPYPKISQWLFQWPIPGKPNRRHKPKKQRLRFVSWLRNRRISLLVSLSSVHRNLRDRKPSF